MKMFCSRCGSNNADSQKFCSNCGNPLPAQVNQPQAQVYNPNQNGAAKRKKFPVWGVVAIIAAILVVIAALAALIIGLSKSNDNNSPVNAEQTVTDDGAQKVADALVQAILTKDISKIEEYIAFSDQFYAALGEEMTPRSEFTRTILNPDWYEDDGNYTFNADDASMITIDDDLMYEFAYCASLYMNGTKTNGKVFRYSDLANGVWTNEINQSIEKAEKGNLKNADVLAEKLDEMYNGFFGEDASECEVGIRNLFTMFYENELFEEVLATAKAEGYETIEEYYFEYMLEELNSALQKAGYSQRATDIAFVPITVRTENTESPYYFTDEAWLVKIDGEWQIIRLDL